MSWATPAEAQGIVGSAVSQASLDMAYNVVEMYVGVTTTALDKIKPRNLRLLKQAESYQAAWMDEQVEVFGRSDVDLVSQDGLQYSKGNRDAHILSPFARIAIKRISWMRERSIKPLTPEQALVLRGKRTPETIGMHAADLGGSITDDDGYGYWEPF